MLRITRLEVMQWGAGKTSAQKGVGVKVQGELGEKFKPRGAL